MKKHLLLLWLSLLPMLTNAYTAKIDGIYYNFSGNEAVVTYYQSGTNNLVAYFGFVVIPDSVVYKDKTYIVTSIGSDAFEYCEALMTISIPNSVTSIGSYAFSKCSGLTSIDIPNSVTSIDSQAFNNCSGLTSVTIGNSVTSIGSYAFSSCKGLTSIDIPNSVTSIGSYAFGFCKGLTSVTIGNSVTSIGSNAFRDSKLRNVLVKSTIPPTLGGTDDKTFFLDQTLAHGILYVPEGCWDAYAFHGKWYAFDDIREVALEEEQLSVKQAYALMETGTFAYSVYDPVNECISTLSRIDENNPNHCWQVIDVEGQHYLYNLGAKKFVATSDSNLSLTDNAKPIGMDNGMDGIIIDERQERQWAFVKNEHMNTEGNIADAVELIEAAVVSKQESCYDLQGRQHDKQQKGINIIRYSDGSTRKVLVR